MEKPLRILQKKKGLAIIPLKVSCRTKPGIFGLVLLVGAFQNMMADPLLISQQKKAYHMIMFKIPCWIITEIYGSAPGKVHQNMTEKLLPILQTKKG